MSTQKTPRMITFNHYTSRKGLSAILKSGVIQESKIRQNDATFGDGVYGTTIPPDKGRRKIAQNNWGRYWKKHAFLGKIDRVIQIKLPNTRIWKAKSCRNILIHKGPIFLKRYKWQVRKVPVLDEEEDSDEE